jgi:hypothetical protein
VNASTAVRSADWVAGSVANANGADAVSKVIAVTMEPLLIIDTDHHT